MNRKLIIPTVGFSALLAMSVLSTNVVRADFEGNGFATQLAEHFNLDEGEVTDYLGQMQDERRQQFQQDHQARLDQAVTDGVITQEQQEALLAKQEQLMASREADREDMQAWFDEQGIDHTALMQYMMGPRGGMMHHRLGLE